jgi:hypothetical protein
MTFATRANQLETSRLELMSAEHCSCGIFQPSHKGSRRRSMFRDTRCGLGSNKFRFLPLPISRIVRSERLADL